MADQPAQAPLLPTTNPNGPTPAPSPGTAVLDVRRRPTITSGIWILLLFLFLNNGNNNQIGGPPDPEAANRMKRLLRIRELKRDGLAIWLGINTTYTNSSTPRVDPVESTAGANATEEPIPFVPNNEGRLSALVPSLHSLLGRNSRTHYYPQNVTGFVKGTWDREDWSYEKLGIEETFNMTALVKVEPPPEGPSEEESEAEIMDEAEELVSRTLPNSHYKRQLPSNESIPLVNVTTTTNRTESRGAFAWSEGGKVTFNLREDLTSVVGAVDYVNSFKNGEGQLASLREGPKEPWELEGPVVYIRGDLTFVSKSSAEYVLDLEGVHYLSSGAIYGWATPTSFPTHIFSIPNLPAFDPAHNATSKMQAAGHCVIKEVDRRIVKDRAELSANGFENPASTQQSQSPFAGSSPPPLCSFVFAASVAPLPPSYPAHLYREYYASLFHPTGASILSPPIPEISYLLYSTSCGLVLKGHGEILESPRLWQRAGTFAIVMMFVQGLLVLLLVRQMETGRGLGNVVKVAYGSIALQAAMDSYFFILTFTIGVVTNTRASLPLLVPSFFALASSLLFGMRYASDIRAAAPPPRSRPTIVAPPPPSREQLSAAAAERRAAAEGDENAGLLEAPAAVPPVAAAVPREPGEMAESVFVGICLAIAVSALLIIILWGWVPFIVVSLYSYWLPQIALNVQRGAARLSLRRDYIIGSTLARLILPLYVYGCPANLLGVEPSRWSIALIFYSIAQATILLLQDSRLGARFFVPLSVLSSLGIHEEDTWNYHPLVLPPVEKDLESGGKGDEETEECPICLEKLDLDLDFEDGSVEAQERRERQRWEIMVPPCGHKAHKSCMETWMGIKSICAVCRRRLPPL